MILPLPPQNRIVSIQLLRALACLLVLMVHLNSFSPLLANTLTGSIGVDLFFIISCYIIGASIERLPPTQPIFSFFVNRFSRVVPYYYLLMFLYMGVAYIAWKAPVEARNLAKSLLFLAQEHDPIHPVGWTLNHEVFFYAVVGMGLLLTRNPLHIASGLLAVLLVARVLPLEAAFLKGFKASINLEFVFGLLIYHYRSKLVPAFRSLGWMAVALVLLLVVMAVSTEWPINDEMKGLIPAGAYYRDTVFLYQLPMTFPRGLFYGLPAAAVFVTVLAQEGRLQRFQEDNLLLRIGNASFTLYLIQHLFFVAMFRFEVHSLPAIAGYGMTIIFVSLHLYRLENVVARFTKRLLVVLHPAAHQAPLAAQQRT